MKEQYHGWLIELIEQQDGYTFCCWTTQERIRVSDRRIYSTPSQALAAAKQRADLEAVRWAMTRFLDDSCLRYKLTVEEVIALEASILEFIVSTSRDRHSVVSTDLPAMNATCEILCTYMNQTAKIQVTRIANISGWYFEKVVFPGEQLLFEALPEAELEVYTSTAWGASLTSKHLCSNLQVCASDAL